LAQRQTGAARDQQVDDHQARSPNRKVLDDFLRVHHHETVVALGSQEVLAELGGEFVALGQDDENGDILSRLALGVVDHLRVEETEGVGRRSAALDFVANEAELIDLVSAVQAVPTSTPVRQHDRVAVLPSSQCGRRYAKHPDHSAHAVHAGA